MCKISPHLSPVICLRRHLCGPSVSRLVKRVDLLVKNNGVSKVSLKKYPQPPSKTHLVKAGDREGAAKEQKGGHFVLARAEMVKAATAHPPKSEMDDGVEEEEEGYGGGIGAGGPKPEIKFSGAVAAGPPVVCLLRCAIDSAAGALMGSFIGYGSGLMKKKGLKGSFSDVGSSAKTFAVLSGVHGLVMCLVKALRGKDDAINAGIAGCCTGLAFSVPGPPGVLLQSCLGFGAFSFLIEGLNKKEHALAHQPHPAGRGDTRAPEDVLPPFTLPIPRQFLEGLSSFSKSLPQSKGISSN